jgi:hypothetical protein
VIKWMIPIEVKSNHLSTRVHTSIGAPCITHSLPG